MTGKIAIFDCDGTLVDGQANICESMEAAFAHAGLALPDRHEIRRIVGLSLPQAVRLLAPEIADDLRTEVVDTYRQHYRAAREEGRLEEPLYDGIAGLLEELRDLGWALGVATGKSDRGLRACLASHNILDWFVTLQTADRHPSKPHPAMLEAALFEAGLAPADAVMVGDTSFDITMARAAGVRAIGVDWGYHTPQELLSEGAEAVAHSVAELKELLL